MRRRTRNLRRATACLLLAASASAAAEDRYRVEVLVFRHLEADPPPSEVTEIRTFRDTWEANEAGAPPVPMALDVVSDQFGDARRRLERIADYEPLVSLTWEQSQFDYHPPVRVHDQEVVAEELVFRHDVAWADLTTDDPLAAYRVALYRLDGSIRLRRSRFLHLDVDLEYRIDNPDWATLPPPLPTLEQLAIVEETPGGQPAARIVVPESGARQTSGTDSSTDLQASAQARDPEPFRVHRLLESRQVRTGDLHYFDTPYLGVLARVTRIAGD